MAQVRAPYGARGACSYGVWKGLLLLAVAGVLACQETAESGDDGEGIFAVCAEVASRFASPTSPCLRDADCGDAICRQDPEASRALETVSLTCASPLGNGTPGQSCEAPADCVHGLCLVAGTCRSPCRVSADCDQSKGASRCAAAYTRLEAGGAGDSGGGASGDASLAMVCLPVVQAPEGVEVAFGDMATGRPGEDLSMEIATPLRSLHGVTSVCPTTFSALALEVGVEGGERLFLSRSLVPGQAPPINSVSAPGALVSLLLPTSPRGELRAERHRLLIRVADEGVVFPLRAWRAQEGDTLDMDVFYVGAMAWDVRSGVPQEVAAALAELETIYAEVPLRLGSVRHHHLGPAIVERFSRLDAPDLATSNDFQELLRLGRGPRSSAVAVFLLQSLGGDTLGVSGTVPGPLPNSLGGGGGVVLAVDTILTAVRAGTVPGFGLVLAHELGHFFGLPHTTERTGVVREALADTPVCGIARDENSNAQVDVEECTGLGAGNLMFWNAQGSELSEEQRALVRASVMLHP